MSGNVGVQYDVLPVVKSLNKEEPAAYTDNRDHAEVKQTLVLRKEDGGQREVILKSILIYFHIVVSKSRVYI